MNAQYEPGDVKPAPCENDLTDCGPGDFRSADDVPLCARCYVSLFHEGLSHERDRIAELEAENAALRKENGELEASVLSSARARDEARAAKRGEAISARIDGRKAEGQRVRREMLETFRPYEMHSDQPIATAESFVDALDRICPPEKE